VRPSPALGLARWPLRQSATGEVVHSTLYSQLFAQYLHASGQSLSTLETCQSPRALGQVTTNHKATREPEAARLPPEADGHFQSEQLGDHHRLIAAQAGTAEAEFAAEALTVRAALLPDEALLAVGAGVDIVGRGPTVD
jgi:hypothetical protein